MPFFSYNLFMEEHRFGLTHEIESDIIGLMD